MKKFSHAWLAFMAIERLNSKKQDLKEDAQKRAEGLIYWFMSHKDDITQGAWYPDLLIKDMADHHVLKIAPEDKATNKMIVFPKEKFRSLPPEYLIYQIGKDSPVKNQGFAVNKDDNLPDRCESLTEAVIDHFKILNYTEKGSPVSPTHNQVALWFFMLSHYVADAHVPVHCDARKFSDGEGIHGLMEKAWDDEIRKYYRINAQGTRFLYDVDGFPLMSDAAKNADYQNSFLKMVDDEIAKRKLSLSFGTDNENKVWNFMDAICHNSYLTSYRFFPPDKGPENITANDWQNLANPALSFKDLSQAVLADAIDSILRVWFYVWSQYMDWLEKPDKKKKDKEDEPD